MAGGTIWHVWGDDSLDTNPNVRVISVQDFDNELKARRFVATSATKQWEVTKCTKPQMTTRRRCICQWTLKPAATETPEVHHADLGDPDGGAALCNAAF